MLESFEVCSIHNSTGPDQIGKSPNPPMTACVLGKTWRILLASAERIADVRRPAHKHNVKSASFLPETMRTSQSKPHLHINTPGSPHTPRYRPKPPKTSLPTDVIDLMDDSTPTGLLRHHDGPYDPVTRSAYLPENKSPLAALAHSTKEALNATPESAIRDSLTQHVPLQNTAVVGPGEHVPGGAPDDILSNYKEENLLGDVGRWDGIEYNENDRRAKGHPGWDGAFVNRGHNAAERAKKKGRGQEEWGEYPVQHDGMIEMVAPERDLRVNGMQASAGAIEEAEHEQHHSGLVGGIKKRLSLVRRHKDHSREHSQEVSPTR
jgi:hypothetical protein